MVVPVHADGFVSGFTKYSKKMTMYTGSKYGNVYSINMGKKTKGAKKVTVKSSNKKVLEPFHFGKPSNDVMASAKKPGKATLTIKVKKGNKTKTYKIKVKVKKRVNPFKSFKVGKIKATSKFKRDQLVDVNVANNSKKKISIKLKSGYKLKKIVCTTWNPDNGEGKEKTIKNNSTITAKEDLTNLYIRIYDSKTKTTFAYYVNFI